MNENQKKEVEERHYTCEEIRERWNACVVNFDEEEDEA